MKVFILFALVTLIRADEGLDNLESSSAEKIMEQSDTSSIESAVMRLEALNNRVKRLRNKLTNELETTVSFLKFHLTQRKLQGGRLLNENPLLDQQNLEKNYLKMKDPQTNEDIPNI